MVASRQARSQCHTRRQIEAGMYSGEALSSSIIMVYMEMGRGSAQVSSIWIHSHRQAASALGGGDGTDIRSSWRRPKEECSGCCCMPQPCTWRWHSSKQEVAVCCRHGEQPSTKQPGRRSELLLLPLVFAWARGRVSFATLEGDVEGQHWDDVTVRVVLPAYR